MTGATWAAGWIGLSQFGICEVTATRNNYKKIYLPIIRLAFSFLFVSLSFVTYHYFKKHMPQGESLNRRKYQENEVVTRFTIGMSIILALFSVAMTLIFFNCLNSHP